MLELISLMLGGLLRLAPEFLKRLQARDDHAHELEMTRLQLQIDQARATQQIDLVHAQGAVAADSGELAALAEALRLEGGKGGGWSDRLSRSVRPVLTYWWCIVLYTLAKAVTIMLAWQSGAGMAGIAPLLVTEFDRAVIGSIMAFWFVDRSLRRGRL
ncbi:hypothetical protein [Leptothrix discophora]|uniref:Uncharacterized protein n=1 Tax=Leptothrix discophora TaxID=89 RepID=A0ABT9G1G4_LEPDI|nr:hypothetical protein [Leptothrix discophora]MDP4300334.1 hypothetical protein [Leptothrix discophora]